MNKVNLKTLLIVASQKVKTVDNNQTPFNSVEEFEEAIIDNIIDTIRDSDYFHSEYNLSDVLLSVSNKKVNINIDWEFYVIDSNNPRVLQAVWNNNLYQIADLLSDRLDYEITVLKDETENIEEYKDILEGLTSKKESDALSAISVLSTQFVEIEKRSERTYVVTCNKYSDCVEIALDYLKDNNKQFEGEQYVDVIATTDNGNTFVVLTK